MKDLIIAIQNWYDFSFQPLSPAVMLGGFVFVFACVWLFKYTMEIINR